MKVTTTKDEQVNLVRALLYGDSGAGKTTSLGTLPEDRTLIIALERGLLPLRHRNYQVLQADSWEDLQEIHAAMTAGEVGGDGGLSFQIAGEVIRGIRVLGIDSLSECNELCKKHILEVARPGLMHERTRGKSDKPEGVYDDQMTMEDWGALGRKMGAFISAMVHLPVHVVMTCLADWQEDKRTGVIHRVPALNGKLSLHCAAYFDLVMHMESIGEGEEAQRVWRTANDGQIIAKDSTGELPEFVAPDWRGVFGQILTVHNHEATTASAAEGHKYDAKHG